MSKRYNRWYREVQEYLEKSRGVPRREGTVHPMAGLTDEEREHIRKLAEKHWPPR